MPRVRTRVSIGRPLASARRSLRALEQSLARLAAQVRDTSWNHSVTSRLGSRAARSSYRQPASRRSGCTAATSATSGSSSRGRGRRSGPSVRRRGSGRRLRGRGSWQRGSRAPAAIPAGAQHAELGRVPGSATTWRPKWAMSPGPLQGYTGGAQLQWRLSRCRWGLR